MKKILSFLLVATMLCALFVLPSAADDKINYKVDIPYVKTAPKIDGTVKANEYGKSLPLHTYSESKSQFADTEHNELSNWDFDFHMAWDENNLYMAWVVKSDIHAGLPEKHFDNDGNIIDGDFVESDYGWMWKYSCVQFILTPGVPDASKKQFQTSEWSGNYLEVGLCLTDGGKQCRIAWSKPTGADALDPNDWDAVIVRNDSKKTTTYEVRIPWNKSGLTERGDGVQFGLTYAVASQEFFDTKKGMIEWQDGMLGGKNADNAAIVTLTGNKQVTVSTISVEPPKNELTEGQLPATVTDDTVKLTIDSVDTGITAEAAVIFTSPEKMSNTNWAHCLLLKPLGNDKYQIVESKAGDGSGEVKFDTATESGMIVAAFHTDGAENSTGKDRKEAAVALAAGTELTLFGVDVEKAERTYKNAMLYVSNSEEDPGDESSEPVSSEAESSEVEESSKVDEVSKTSSVAESSNTNDDGGSLTWLWIVLAIIVVAVVAAVVVIVLKKKKANN